MRAKSKTIVLIIIALLLFTGQSWAQNTGRYIVTIRRPVNNAVANAGGRVIHQYGTIPAIAIEIPNAAIPGLLRNPNVVSIEPDVVMWATASAKQKPISTGKPSKNDPPAQPDQVLPWGVDRIDAEFVWSDLNKDGVLDEGSITGAGINVAVIDTGIDYTHPDLEGNFAKTKGINIINTRKTPKDDNGHGTHVAGTIAASYNDIGVIGVAPEATLYAVKVLDRTGNGWISDIMAGIEWCINNNIDVINMSLGGYPTIGSTTDIEFEAVCDSALSSGIIVVASAGNESLPYPGAPARYSSVISVGATNSNDNLASFSNRGFDIAAPGVYILSTIPGSSYAGDWSGTSMACPHVVGTLALYFSDGYIKPKTIDDLNGLIAYLRRCADGDYNVIDAQETVLGIQNGNN